MSFINLKPNSNGDGFYLTSCYGFELYYRNIDGKDKFVLLGGTNRAKTLSEIDLCLSNLDTLKHSLSSIRSDYMGSSNVMLMNMSRYQLPNMSPETIQLIYAYVESLPETPTLGSAPKGLLGIVDDPETGEMKSPESRMSHVKLLIEHAVQPRDPLSVLNNLINATENLK